MQYRHRRLGQSSKMSEGGSHESDSLSHSGSLPSTVLVADLHYAQQVHNAVVGPQIALLGRKIDKMGEKIDNLTQRLECGMILFFAWCCFDVYKRSTKGIFQTPSALSVLLLMNIAQDE